MEAKKGVLEVSFAGEVWTLLPEKALYWDKHKVLVISDVHLGKAKYFQQAGVAIPGSLGEFDLQKIEQLLLLWKPKSCIFLGDLFHSSQNSDWELFAGLLKKFKSTLFTLIRGNHDFLDLETYAKVGLQVKDFLIIDGVCFQHEPILKAQKHFVIAGHVHPGCLIKSKGRQTFRLPCFHLLNHQLVMPAFGNFTGLHMVSAKKDESRYPIGANQVFLL